MQGEGQPLQESDCRIGIEDQSNHQESPLPSVRHFQVATGVRSGLAEVGIVQEAAGIPYGPGSSIVNSAGSVRNYSAGQARDLSLVAGRNGIIYLDDTSTWSLAANSLVLESRVEST